MSSKRSKAEDKAVGGGVGIAREVNASCGERGSVSEIDFATKAAAESEESTNQPMLIVDPDGNGDYRTFPEAHEAAKPGMAIKFMRGKHNGPLVIEKDGLTIIGTEGVIIECSDCDTIRFNADSGTIKNMRVVCDSPYPVSALNIVCGEPLLEDCDLIGGANIIRVQRNAHPVIRGNRIHISSIGNGILIEGAGGLIEDNSVYDLGGCGICARPDSTTIIRGNRIHDCCEGVTLEGAGTVQLEHNNVHDNMIGIDLTEAADLLMRDNHIYSNGTGIVSGQGMDAVEEDTMVAHNAQPERVTITDNEVDNNYLMGIKVPCWNPQYVLLNDIYGNKTEVCTGNCDGCVNNAPHIACCGQGDFCFVHAISS